jgi:TP901 family phage tail tape measure protein
LTVESLNASVGLDIRPLRAGIQQGQTLTAGFGQTLQNTLVASAARATAALNGFAGAAGNAGRQLDPLTAKLNNVGSALSKVGSSAVSVGRSLTLSLTAPLLALGANAVRLEASFQDAMNQLQGASGASAEQLKILSDKATALGADLTLPATSATDAANAMLNLSRAGLNVRDVFDASRPTLQLAAATHVDNAKAAEILAVTLNEFGLSAKETAHAADLLTAAGNRTVGGINALYEGLRKVGPTMHDLKVPLNDTVTALVLLNKGGLKGAEAGTALRGVFARLADPSNKMKAAMDAVGLSFFDGSGKLKSFGDIAEMLKTKLGGLTDKQRAMVEHILGGNRAMAALSVLAQAGGKGFEEMAGKVNKAGEAARQAELQMKGLPGAIEKMKSAFEAASKSAIEPISKDLEKVGTAVGEMLTKFAELPAGTRRFIVEVLGLLAVLGPTLVILGKTAQAVGGVTKAIAEIRAGQAIAQMSSTGVALKALGTAAKWVIGILTSFVAYLGGPVIAALAALAAAVTLFRNAWTKDWFDIQEQFKAAWDTILDIFNTVQTVLGTAWAAFTDLLKGNWVDAWAEMKSVVIDVMGFIAKLMTNPVGAIQELVATFGAHFAERMAQKGPGETAAPAKADLSALGAGGAGAGGAGGGTNNPALDNLGSKSKAQTDAEKLDDAIKDMEKRLSLLSSGTPNALVDTIVQYTTDKTVGMNDPRLKHLTTGNKAVKDLEEGEDQRREFSKQLLEKQQEAKRLREFLKTGVAPEEGFKGQFGKANLTQEQLSLNAQVTSEVERLKKQTEAKKAADQALYELNRNTYIFNAKETGGLQFSPEQQKAMVLFKKNVDELTEADLKQAHAMLQKERILKANQAAATFMEQRQEALTAAVEKGFEASEKSNDAWDAFTSKSKYAVAALEQLGVVWDELTEKDKKLVATHLEVIKKNTEAIAAYKQFASSMERVFNDAFLNLKQGFGGFFKSIVQGFEQMLQEMAAKYLASQLANVLLKGLNGLTGGRGNFADILGSLAGVADLGGGSSGDVSPSIFGLAGGGLVAQDTPYLVGERGPELFTPSRSGRITPNAQLAGAGGGGPIHITMNIATPDAGSFRRSQHQISQDATRAIREASRRSGR